MNRRNRWLAVLAGTALALAMTATVFAFSPGQLAQNIAFKVVCNVDTVTVTATVIDQASNIITDLPVAWSIPSPDTIDDTTDTTDASGGATTIVTLDNNVSDPRTLTATTADGFSANVDIICGGVAGITAPGPINAPGLPRTSTMPDGSPVGNLPIATILALLAVLAGGGIIVRRFVFSPR